MKSKLLPIALFALSLVIVGASEDYEELLKYAQGRGIPDFAIETSIIVLGPDYVDEYYPSDNDGEDSHVVAWFTTVLPAAEKTTLGEVFNAAEINSARGDLEVRVIRASMKQPHAKIVGDIHGLHASQFELLPGDILIVAEPQ